jgi:hypothetical protein
MSSPRRSDLPERRRLGLAVVVSFSERWLLVRVAHSDPSPLVPLRTMATQLRLAPPTVSLAWGNSGSILRLKGGHRAEFI